MIETYNLCKKYVNDGESEVVAIKNISFRLPNFGMVCVTGTSGCGKTTLLNLLGGFDVPTGGTIKIDDCDITGFDEKKWNQFRAEKMGFLFQNCNLFEEMTVRENVALPLKLLNMGQKTIDDEIESIAKQTDIFELLDKKAKHLSGGQKQRVALARAILKKPEVILADEPTGNLDEKNSKKVFELLKKAAKNCLVVVVTHDLNLAREYSDRVIGLSYGTIERDETFCAEKENDDFVTTDKYKNAKMPLKLCLKMVGELLAKRKVRALITVLVLVITATAFLLIVSIYSSKRYVSIADYIQKRNYSLNQLYMPVDYVVSAYNNSLDMQTITGIKLHNKITNAVGENEIAYVSYNFVEWKYSAAIIGTSTDKLKLFIKNGKLPSADDEIVIDFALAKKMGILDRDFPISVRMGNENVKIVGIVEGMHVPVDKPIDGLGFCTKESFLKAQKNTNFEIKGMGFTTNRGPFEQYFISGSIASSKKAELLCGRMPEKDNEILMALSSFPFSDNMQEDFSEKEFRCFDLYDEKYENAFYNVINLYDYVGEKVIVTGLTADDNQFSFTEDVYQKILDDKPFFYSDYYLWTSNNSDYEDNIKKISENYIRINDAALSSFYQEWERIDKIYVSLLLALFVVFALAVSQMILLFSYGIKDSSEKIGLLRALGVPQRNISFMFTFESIGLTVVSVIVSVMTALVILKKINDFYSIEYFGTLDLTMITVNYLYFAAGIIIMPVLAKLVALIQINQMRKTSIINLLNNEFI